MSSKRLCIVLLDAISACSSPSVPEVPEAPPAQVVVVLSTTTPQVKMGTAPDLDVVVLNEGEASITLVEPGDGSECGWRTPIIEWQPAVPAGGRCRNINTLQPGEVFDLAPGESRRLCDWVGQPHLPAPGRYRVSVTYRNEPDRDFSGLVLGTHDPQALQRLRSSTPLVATSNVLEIEVVE